MHDQKENDLEESFWVNSANVLNRIYSSMEDEFWARYNRIMEEHEKVFDEFLDSTQLLELENEGATCSNFEESESVANLSKNNVPSIQFLYSLLVAIYKEAHLKAENKRKLEFYQDDIIVTANHLHKIDNPEAKISLRKLLSGVLICQNTKIIEGSYDLIIAMAKESYNDINDSENKNQNQAVISCITYLSKILISRNGSLIEICDEIIHNSLDKLLEIVLNNRKKEIKNSVEEIHLIIFLNRILDSKRADKHTKVIEHCSEAIISCFKFLSLHGNETLQIQIFKDYSKKILLCQNPKIIGKCMGEITKFFQGLHIASKQDEHQKLIFIEYAKYILGSQTPEMILASWEPIVEILEELFEARKLNRERQHAFVSFSSKILSSQDRLLIRACQSHIIVATEMLEADIDKALSNFEEEEHLTLIDEEKVLIDFLFRITGSTCSDIIEPLNQVIVKYLNKLNTILKSHVSVDALGNKFVTNSNQQGKSNLVANQNESVEKIFLTLVSKVLSCQIGSLIELCQEHIAASLTMEQTGTQDVKAKIELNLMRRLISCRNTQCITFCQDQIVIYLSRNFNLTLLSKITRLKSKFLAQSIFLKIIKNCSAEQLEQLKNHLIKKNKPDFIKLIEGKGPKKSVAAKRRENPNFWFNTLPPPDELNSVNLDELVTFNLPEGIRIHLQTYQRNMILSRKGENLSQITGVTLITKVPGKLQVNMMIEDIEKYKKWWEQQKNSTCLKKPQRKKGGLKSWFDNLPPPVDLDTKNLKKGLIFNCPTETVCIGFVTHLIKSRKGEDRSQITGVESIKKVKGQGNFEIQFKDPEQYKRWWKKTDENRTLSGIKVKTKENKPTSSATHNNTDSGSSPNKRKEKPTRALSNVNKKQKTAKSSGNIKTKFYQQVSISSRRKKSIETINNASSTDTRATLSRCLPFDNEESEFSGSQMVSTTIQEGNSRIERWSKHASHTSVFFEPKPSAVNDNSSTQINQADQPASRQENSGSTLKKGVQ